MGGPKLTKLPYALQDCRGRAKCINLPLLLLGISPLRPEGHWNESQAVKEVGIQGSPLEIQESL